MKKPSVIYKTDREKNEDQEVGRKVRENQKNQPVESGKYIIKEIQVLNEKIE